MKLNCSRGEQYVVIWHAITTKGHFTEGEQIELEGTFNVKTVYAYFSYKTENGDPRAATLIMGSQPRRKAHDYLMLFFLPFLYELGLLFMVLV